MHKRASPHDSTITLRIKWHSLPLGKIKINVEPLAFQEHDSEGRVIQALGLPCPRCALVLALEAEGVVQGIQLARHYGRPSAYY